MPQTWDPAHTCTDVTLSGSNLIATHSATNSGTNASIFGLNGYTTGRYYWECAVAGGTAIGVGLGNTTSSIITGAYIGGATDTIGWFGNGGGIYNANALQTTIQGFAYAGDTVCVAADLISMKVWFRTGAAGNWNNAAIGSQNPAVASQVGGFTVPAAVSAGGGAVPAAIVATLGDAITGKFAAATWIGAMPDGFSAFDPVLIVPYRRRSRTFLLR